MAADQSHDLFAVLYDELHRVAERSLRRAGPGVTLGTTTLLHEAYLNMANREGVAFADHGHFLAYASRAMRGLVIDYARRRHARKRGSQVEITLDDEVPPNSDAIRDAEELERIGDALERAASLSPGLVELVDLHFFCGFSFTEIASHRGVSERTVQRDWRKAKMLLQELLSDDEQPPASPEPLQ